ncbi:GS catalytic domain-containing protein [Plasmodiophora brassicae]
MIPLWRRGIRRLASKATLGHLNVDELRSMVQNGSVSSVVVGFTDIYGRMMGKRFDAEFFMHDCLDNGTHCCDYLLACDMNMAPIPGFKFANWEKGYGDMHLVPDLSSLRIASWMEEAALVLCDVHYNKDPHDLVQYAPRSMLRRQLDRADKSGYNVLAATELEYYQYRTSYDHAHKSGFDQEAIIPVSNHVEDYHLLQTAREEDLTAEFRKHLRLSGIPVENSKGEAGIGQHELNVKYAEPLCMSDRHVVYKQCLKEVADAKTCSVTFMAKPFTDATGSGCHVHLSLWHQDADGNTANAFVGDQDFDGVKCSDEFRWFLAGWLKFTPDCMPFYAPTVNSYKRFQSSSWAPTRLAWSYDNRTAGYRAVGKGKSLRIECRIPGADVNPYLVFAASLASGLEGIKQKLEPPPCFNGNIYEARQIPEVAKTLPAAVSAFESSEFAREAFGDDVVEHYARFYQSEFETFNKTVTDWERKRYFEMI